MRALTTHATCQVKLDQLGQAQKLLNQAKAIDDKEQLVHLGLGMLHYTKVGPGCVWGGGGKKEWSNC